MVNVTMLNLKQLTARQVFVIQMQASVAKSLVYRNLFLLPLSALPSRLKL